MGTTTFSGPIKAGTIKDTTGTTVGTDKANVGFVLMAQSANVVFGADGTETVVATVPANSQLWQVSVDVTTAFDAGTTNTVDIGDGTTADKYADALDVSSAARLLATSDVSQLGNLVDIGTTDVDVTVTYNQTGTAATAGAATVTVLYLQNRNLS
ncbi:MAG: hypothetical protein ACPHEP_11705 [Acidimicrobiales bacterium]|jgi:hypothetical protein